MVTRQEFEDFVTKEVKTFKTNASEEIIRNAIAENKDWVDEAYDTVRKGGTLSPSNDVVGTLIISIGICI